jgi:hypothetical protein
LIVGGGVIQGVKKIFDIVMPNAQIPTCWLLGLSFVLGLKGRMKGHRGRKGQNESPEVFAIFHVNFYKTT